jgi:ribonuclease-3
MPTAHKLETIIGYKFQNQDLLYLALQHKSMQESNTTNSHPQSNERLEFLGDRVLGLAMATILYEQFPNESEGLLAMRQAVLVSNESLTKVSHMIFLDNYIVMGGGQIASKMRFSNVAANALESVLGSIYLDSNFFKTKEIISKLWEPLLCGMSTIPKDSKNKLQELAAKLKYTAPVYKVQQQTGTAHNPTFTVNVSIPNIGSADGQGSTKRSAEQAAATEFLQCLT